MPSRRTIPDLESGDAETKEDRLFLDGLPSELSQEVQDSDLGYSELVHDSAWNGGRKKNGKRRLTDAEVDEYLNGDLGQYSALEQIILAIIDKNPTSDDRRKDRKHNKDFRQYRLEQAMRHLTGKKPPKGEEGTSEADLVRIAEAYWHSVLRQEHSEEYLEKLIVSALGIPGMEEATAKEISDAAKNPKRDFDRNFQRLMFRVSELHMDSSPISEEQDRRRRQIETAVRALEPFMRERPLPKMKR